MVDETKDSEVFVQLNDEILLKNLYWTANKFIADPDHKQQNSSRDDLIGGYFDRWINRIPEYFIFKKLFRKYKSTKYFEPVVDNLIYTNKTSKNAPDIIGLKHTKLNKYYKFAIFVNNRWKIDKNAPFIEMKVFRNSQKLITIPCSQFKKKHYYAIVESTVPDNYLISAFHHDFFDNDDNFLNEYQNIFDNFVEGNHDLKFPDKLEKYSFGHDEGFKLLGIYKGAILDKIKIIASMNGDEPDKPKYLKNISKFKFPNSIKLHEGSYDNYFIKIASIPIFIEIAGDNSKVKIVRTTDKCISISVEGEVKINDILCPSGDYDLIFKEVYRNAVKYYVLDDIKDSKDLTVEKEITLLSGLLKHFGDKQTLISCKINRKYDSKINIVGDNSNNITFEIEGTVEINDMSFDRGTYRFYFEAHDIEKSKHDFTYKKFKMSEIKDNKKILKKKDDFRHNGSLSSSEYNVVIPSGKKKWVKDEKDFSEISMKILHNSSVDLIKRTKKNMVVEVNGKVEIEKHILPTGFYNIPFKKYSLNKKEYYKFDFEDELTDVELKNKLKIKHHPICLSKTDSEDLKKYLKNADIDGKFINSIFDMNDIEDKKIIDPFKIFSYRDKKDNMNKSKNNYVPVSVYIPLGSEVKIYEKRQSSMIIGVKNKVWIDNEEINDSQNKDRLNFWKLTFSDFERTSKKDEIILSKGALISSNVSSKQNLIEDIEKLTSNNSIY